MVLIALVAVLLLLAILAHEGRKSLSSLAIVLGVFTLVACVVYGIRFLGIGQLPKLKSYSVDAF